MGKLRIPIYSDLSPKSKQRANMVLGGFAALGLVMVVSGFVGGPSAVNGPAASKEPPKPKPLGAVPGQQLDSKDVWVGGAAKEVTRVRDDVKSMEADLRREVEAQQRINREMQEKIAALTGERGAETRAQEARRQQESNSGAQATDKALAAPVPTPRVPDATNTPASLGGQPRTGRLPTSVTPSVQGQDGYPPGQPNRAYAGAAPAPATQAAPETPPVGLIRVGRRESAGAGSATGPSKDGAAGDVPATNQRRVDNYLPVSHTRAILIGGLAAPTGGQAQSNPVPVLLRLVDMAVLPNNFRAMVKDCLVVGEGFGDQSAERAYIRTTVLSCVLKDGTVLEVPLKGSIFGEDGMNGMRGALVQKQGQILTNALMAGIASGIGSGLAQSTQQVTTTALGSTATNPTDTQNILKQGIGTGVGKALDRLSQYYISLAEKTFPVIEVQGGRTVDVVVTQGVYLDVNTASSGKPGQAQTGASPGKAPGMVRSLMRTAIDQENDE